MTDAPTQDELFDKLVGKLEERLMGKITEHVEGQIGGLKSKTDELLGKLVDKKAENAGLVAQLEQVSAQLDTLKAAPPKQQQTPPADTRDIILSRESARDPAAYRRAKAEAQQRGVQVRFEGR